MANASAGVPIALEVSGPTDPPRQSTQNESDINEQIRSNLQQVFQGDIFLRGADLQAMVDDQAITLTGTVQSQRQHQRALELASVYMRYREIEDKLAIR